MKLLINSPAKALRIPGTSRPTRSIPAAGRTWSYTTGDEQNIGLKYILGLLNSRPMNWYYQTVVNPEKGEALAQVKRNHIVQLPIPPATDAQKTPIIQLVEKILSNPDSPEVPQLEAEIDRLVYALYGLTDEEIAVVEGKQ